MCRYNAETSKFETNEQCVGETKYLAISHVWGQATWRNVVGVDAQILASDEKAKFVAERLPFIVGDDWFWMDILCVDQRNRAARVAVTQHIPTIFRFAERTILVRDGTGFRECCNAVAEPFGSWARNPYNGVEAISEHLAKTHLRNNDFNESILSRLWVLQEVMLSDIIQFVHCDFAAEEQVVDESDVTFDQLSSAFQIPSTLLVMAKSWADYSRERDNPAFDAFMRAVFASGVASRTPASRRIPARVPMAGDFKPLRSSLRRTTLPRDFILAIMPQYTFYTVPENAKEMTYPQLFIDCVQQLRKANGETGEEVGDKVQLSDIFPSVPARYDEHYAPQFWPEDIPEPFFLADFARSWSGSRWGDGRYRKVVPKPVSTLTTLQCQRIIFQASRLSKFAWGYFHHLDLVFYRDASTNFNPIQEALPELASTLARAEISHDFQERLTSLLQTNRDATIRLAALISCDFGMAAYEWSKQTMSPMVVKFRGTYFLALIPNHLLSEDTECVYFLIPASRYYGFFQAKRFLLVAYCRRGVEGPLRAFQCLFPVDMAPIGWKVWKYWKF